MPVLALSQTQCTSIQSPALCATLSRLHLNKHTSRAIVFGPSKYGGLEMPELYASEGIGQLRLFMGHLRLRDKTASLILIDISYLQHIVGSSTLFFNLPFTIYGHSTDGRWLSSIWQFLNSIGFQLYIKQAQPPYPPRQNDIALMDYFVSLRLKPKLLRVLNGCRIYLQVIYLSDICSADGSHILCPYKHGHRLPTRTSALDWPYQPKPPATAWKQWISTLQQFEANNKLTKCLGNWVNSSHQQWEHFLSPTTSTLYVKSAGTWTTFRPLQQETLRQTRATSQPKYDLRTPDEPCDLPLDAVPTTIIKISNSPHVKLLPSNSPLCPLLPSTSPQHIQRDTDFSDPHPYYTQLLDWDRSEIESITPSLITAMTDNKLHICADGSYVKEIRQGSHAWVFADNQRHILWKGAGPSMGHTSVMTPYRAELSGLTSIPFLLLWVCNEHDVESGDVTIYCDNISALNQVFTKTRPSNNPLKQLAADIDLITCAKDILLQLPVDVHISKEWVKGHYTGKNKELKHILNDMADQLATDYNTFQRPLTGVTPIPSPISEVELLHNGMIITSRLHHIIKEAHHAGALKACVLKQAGWDNNTFQKVDFTAHKQAFNSHSRIHRISVSKLIHGLYQTKLKDNQFYGTSPTCPCCHLVKESLNHMFSCTSKEVTEHRQLTLQSIEEALDKISTPNSNIRYIVHGISTWTNSQGSHNLQIRAPTRGSIKTPDVMLTQAFTEQTIDVGWDQFLRGRVSIMWGKAFSAHKSEGTQNMESSTWVKRLILKVWDYSISLWKFCSGIVHGTTKQENIEKCLAELRNIKYRKNMVNTPRIHSSFHLNSTPCF
jgi:hypothetical protein